MAFFGSTWFEDDEEDAGIFSHWAEDFSYGDESANCPCDTCLHNGNCDRQKYMMSDDEDDCDKWSENKKR